MGYIFLIAKIDIKKQQPINKKVYNQTKSNSGKYTTYAKSVIASTTFTIAEWD